MDISCKSRNCNSCVLRDYMGENSIGMQLYGCKKIGNCNDNNGLSVLEEIKIAKKKKDLMR